MSAKINAAEIEFWYKSYRTFDGINVVRLACQNVTSPPQKWYGSQTNTNFAGENICHGPKISFFLMPIELDFQRNVWICMSAKINAATIEFWYKSYRTCDDINVVRLASQNITSPPQKNDMVVKQTQILQGKTYVMVMGPKFANFWIHQARFSTQCLDLYVGKN